MKNQSLQYYMHDGPSAFRFELAGDLDSDAARDLDQAWRTASAVIGDRELVVDMTFVASVGPEGRSLLARWHSEGARLIAKSKVSRELAEVIVGGPLPEFASTGNADAKRTWLPFHISFGAPKFRLTTLFALVLLPLHAASHMPKSASSSAGAEHMRRVPAASASETSAFAGSQPGEMLASHVPCRW